MILALLFADAAYHKLYQGGPRLEWAFSDNLRHILAYEYSIVGSTPSALVRWIMAEPWRYRLAAVGNLLSQSLVVGACCFPYRPRLRALFGSFFILEILGLAVMMGPVMYQFLAWLPLGVVFVDWDALFGPKEPTCPEAPRAATGRPDRATPFILGVLTCFLFTAVAFPGQWSRTYPWTTFNMFSGVWARQPRSVHQPFELTWADFDLPTDEPASPRARWWAVAFWGHLIHSEDPAELHAGLRALRASLESDRAFSGCRFSVLESLPGCRFQPLGPIRCLTLKKVVYQVPAYPAPPEAVHLHEGRVASLSQDDHFCAVVVLDRREDETGRPYLEVLSSGYDAPRFRFEYLVNDTEGPFPLETTRRGNRWYYEKKSEGTYRFLTHVGDSSLGIAEHVYLK
jgi:hypothetical protein